MSARFGVRHRVVMDESDPQTTADARGPWGGNPTRRDAISIVFTTGRRDSFTPTRAQQARKTLKSNAVWQHQKSARARTCRMVGRRAANVGLL